MPSRNSRFRIQDIINAAKTIQSYTAGMTFKEFQQNEILIKAILYDFVVIGEAAINVSSEIKSRSPQIPWRIIGDMRNVIAHEYFQVNLKIIWNTIQHNLPGLVTQLEELLQTETLEDE